MCPVRVLAALKALRANLVMALARKKIRASLRKPGDQTYLRVPSIPSVAWQPYPSPLGRLRAHSFASPPHDGFAFVEDSAGAAVLQMANQMPKPFATFQT